MARRSDIDWEQVERLYIAGQLTIRQIADKCGISVSVLTAKAKKNEWKRNLSKEIKALTKAKIAAIDTTAIVEESAQQSAQQSAQNIKASIEQASDVAAGIVLKHRQSLQRDNARASQLEEKLDALIKQAADIKELDLLVRAYKNLIEAKNKIIALERQAFGLDEKDSNEQNDEFANLSEDALTAIAAELAAQIGLLEDAGGH